MDVLVKLNSLQTYTDVWGDYEFIVAPGTYTISISKTNYQTVTGTVTLTEGDNEFNAQLTLIPTMESIEVRWISVEPLALYVGQQIIVQAQVVNISGSEGDFPIVCNIDGISQTQTIHLTASGDGSWELVVFRITMNTPGTFTVAVGDKSQLIRVAEEVVAVFCCPYCGSNTLTHTEYQRAVDGICPEGWELRWGRCYRTLTEPITTESLLAEHIEPEIGGVRVYFKQLGADGKIHTYSRAAMQCTGTMGYLSCDVMCPICKGTMDFTADYNTNTRKVATRLIIDHIKGRHGEKALYCVNVPEGGYAKIV